MADTGTSGNACVDVIDMATTLDELGHDTIDHTEVLELRIAFSTGKSLWGCEVPGIARD